jgi:hypothetical protein
VVVTCPGSCSVVGFGISIIEPSGSTGGGERDCACVRACLLMFTVCLFWSLH